ncbi:MAG TPA: hypothetical protein VGM67_15795 [Gemmatimonadaceae bacterium]|jgi:hypothetical protein
MSLQRFLKRTLPFAAVALVGAAPIAFAQGQEVFEWNGRVDREIQITMRGNRLSTNAMTNSDRSRGASQRVFMQLPRQDGQMVVRVLNGRGRADVVEQPSAQNGYTAAVRVQDQSGGADNYRIAAYWQPYANGDVVRPGRGIGRDINAGINPGVGRIGRNADQSILHWSGNVDGQLEIRVSNGRVTYRNLGGNQPTSIRADQGAAAGRRISSRVSVFQNQGRGSVTVVQQPSAYNGYTTVIRVNDPQGGYGFYDFDLVAQ